MLKSNIYFFSQEHSMACAYMTKLSLFPIQNDLDHISHLDKPLAHLALQTVLKYHLTHIKTAPEKFLAMKQYGYFRVNA